MATTDTPKPVHCRRVDGLPGTPCKTCGRIVVRKGSGRGLYRLTHEAATTPTAKARGSIVCTDPRPIQHGSSVFGYCAACGRAATVRADDGSFVRHERTSAAVIARNLAAGVR
jgi:hypothetical protein